ncbi:MAG: respiratory nitrate reductase subunit gamma [Bacteroidia bacterium 43-41]|nr:MAG: respiratory nitrate reductase subunit gamma [Bacteroidia bacterium 43-41]
MSTSDYLNNFFLGYLPYIAFGVFFAGFIYRVVKRNNTIQANSTQFISKDRGLYWGSLLFHYAIILVFFGHLFGLLTPKWVYDWFMSHETKRMLAIILGSLSGGVALLGITVLTIRRFTNKRICATSKFQDYFIVSLLLLQIALGLWSTYLTSQSTVEEYMSAGNWAQGVALFKPDSWRFIADLDIVYKLHIVNGFLIFILFPFTKLMHMIMIPIRFALDYFKKF